MWEKLVILPVLLLAFWFLPVELLWVVRLPLDFFGSSIWLPAPVDAASVALL
jgi:hypothetical protein